MKYLVTILYLILIWGCYNPLSQENLRARGFSTKSRAEFTAPTCTDDQRNRGVCK